MNTFLKPLAFTICFLTASFLTSALPVQEKFVPLRAVDSSVSPAVIKAAGEKFFSELSDEYFLNRYYEFMEDPENAAGAEKSRVFDYLVADLNGDGRMELFVTNKNLCIAANCETVVYEVGENNTLTKILDTDGVFSVSTAAGAGGYKIIRTNRHESALERSVAEFRYNAALGEYQQIAKPKLIKNKK